MRISKHDVPVDAYTVAETPNAEGYPVKTLTKTVSAQGMDLQPIGNKVDLRPYGLEKVTAGAIGGFYETFTLWIGMVINPLVGNFAGTTYMVKGLKPWYSHSEAILEPFKAVLP